MLYCSNLTTSGFCVDADCDDNHADVCNICDGIQIIPPDDPRKHFMSRQHLRTAYEKGVVNPESCPICAKSVSPNSYNFVQHWLGQKHQQLASRKRISPVPELSSTVTRRCFPCNALVSGKNWTAHLTKSGHLKRTAKQTSAGIVVHVLPGHDYGLVDAGSWAHVFRGFDIRDAGAGSMIKSATITSPIQNAPFHIAPWKSRKVITKASPFMIPVNFFRRDSSGVVGRIDAKLDVTLTSRSLGDIIIRFPLSGTLAGTRAATIVQSLAPTAPYQRPTFKEKVQASRSRRSTKKALRGESVSFRPNIDFVVPLPFFEVPSQLREAISGKSLDNQEDAIAKLIPKQASSESHGRYWSNLLWVEELQVEEDLHQFDMEARRLQRDGPFYSLEVPGLAERRPSVMINDKIKLFPVGGHDEDGSGAYIGYVHRVEARFVFLKMHPRFDANMPYDVEFCVSRSPFRRMHQALLIDHGLERVLYPTTLHVPLKDELVMPSGFMPLDSRMEDNEPQINAVKSILGLPGESAPFIIFGPPGTGKTLVVVEAIRQLLRSPATKILACAPSNFAADVIAERLVEFGLTPNQIFRLNALSRPVNQLPNTLAPYSLVQDGRFEVPPISDMLQYRVIISTCVSSSFPFAMGAPNGHFSHIFVDEAGYALEPECLVPILTMADSETRVILSGDPKQLGPIAHSASAKAFDFAVSLLERLMKVEVYQLASASAHNPLITKLTHNYRSHADILTFPNNEFYNGELVPKVDRSISDRLLSWERLNGTRFPVIFHAIHGGDEREEKSPSYFNRLELALVDEYLRELLDNPSLDIGPEDIGIISPYSAHNKKLRTLEIVKENKENLKTGTVESFQAQERPVIIMSTVRSSRDKVQFDIRHVLGFVQNPKRLNVAITRAKSLLVVMGDPAVLSLDYIWNEFLHYVYRRGGWRGVGFELPPLDEDEDDETFGGTTTVLSGVSKANGHHHQHDTELPIREDD